MPDVETMGVVGTIAPARQYCLLSRLYRHRADNLNMSSTWLWPRNDLIANVGVLVAAGAACLLASRWSDIIVGYIHRGAVSWVRFQCFARRHSRTLPYAVHRPSKLRPSVLATSAYWRMAAFHRATGRNGRKPPLTAGALGQTGRAVKPLRPVH
jgi:hypothetical protein